MSDHVIQDELMQRRVEAAQRLLALLIQRDLDELERGRRESRGSLDMRIDHGEGTSLEREMHPLVRQELEVWGEG